MGIGIRDCDWGLLIGDWYRGLVIRDQVGGLESGLGLGIGIGDWRLGLGIGIWIGYRDRGLICKIGT